jgi:hypothetical protein
MSDARATISRPERDNDQVKVEQPDAQGNTVNSDDFVERLAGLRLRSSPVSKELTPDSRKPRSLPPSTGPSLDAGVYEPLFDAGKTNRFSIDTSRASRHGRKQGADAPVPVQSTQYQAEVAGHNQALHSIIRSHGPAKKEQGSDTVPRSLASFIGNTQSVQRQSTSRRQPTSSLGSQPQVDSFTATYAPAERKFACYWAKDDPDSNQACWSHPGWKDESAVRTVSAEVE